MSSWLGYEGAGCAAVHLNFMLGWTAPEARPETPGEIAAIDALRRIWHAENGYMVIQSTRPLTLSYAMADSPLGVAAWILEKFHRWSQLPDDDLWAVHSRERILDNIMVYLVSGTFDTAAWLYRGVLDEPVPAGARVTRPVAVADYRVNSRGSRARWSRRVATWCAGPRSRAAATSPRWSSPRCSSRTCAASCAACVERVRQRSRTRTHIGAPTSGRPCLTLPAPQRILRRRRLDSVK